MFVRSINLYSKPCSIFFFKLTRLSVCKRNTRTCIWENLPELFVIINIALFDVTITIRYRDETSFLNDNFLKGTVALGMSILVLSLEEILHSYNCSCYYDTLMFTQMHYT